MSSCVTRSLLVHARAFLSCQALKGSFSRPSTISLSCSLLSTVSSRGHAVGTVYQRGNTRTCQSRGTCESWNSPKTGLERPSQRRIRSLPPGTGEKERERELTLHHTRGVRMSPYDFSAGPDVANHVGKDGKETEGERSTTCLVPIEARSPSVIWRQEGPSRKRPEGPRDDRSDDDEPQERLSLGLWV